MFGRKQQPTRRASDSSAHCVSLGSGDRVVIFLHGLFGTPGHWKHIMERLAKDYRVIAPQLPVDYQPDRRAKGVRSIAALTDYVVNLLSEMALPPFVICGNSLGGLLAIEICLRHPERVKGLVLAGSAGLYERNLTHGVRPRPNREFIRAVISDIFYDPALATEELVDDWYRSIQDRNFVRFIIGVSRATRDRTLTNELSQLKLPTLIVWGRNDNVTPPAVAESFKQQIEHSELRFIDRCGHAPNLEQPELFAEMLQEFLPTCFSGGSTRMVRWPSDVEERTPAAPSRV